MYVYFVLFIIKKNQVEQHLQPCPTYQNKLNSWPFGSSKKKILTFIEKSAGSRLKIRLKIWTRILSESDSTQKCKILKQLVNGVGSGTKFKFTVQDYFKSCWTKWTFRFENFGRSSLRKFTTVTKKVPCFNNNNQTSFIVTKKKHTFCGQSCRNIKKSRNTKTKKSNWKPNKNPNISYKQWYKYKNIGT